MIEFTLRTDILESVVGAEFSDDDQAVLREFMEEYRRLQDSSISKKDLPCSWSFAGDAGRHTFKAHLPSEDEMAILLHRLRPFVLQNEPASFDRAVSVLRRRMSWAELRPLFKLLRDLWVGVNLADELPLFIQHTQVDIQALFSNWVNGEEYHRDRDRHRVVAEMRMSVPSEFLQFMIISAALDKVSAVRHVAKVVRLAIGELRKIEFEGGTIERRSS